MGVPTSKGPRPGSPLGRTGAFIFALPPKAVFCSCPTASTSRPPRVARTEGEGGERGGERGGRGENHWQYTGIGRSGPRMRRKVARKWGGQSRKTARKWRRCGDFAVQKKSRHNGRRLLDAAAGPAHLSGVSTVGHRSSLPEPGHDPPVGLPVRLHGQTGSGPRPLRSLPVWPGRTSSPVLMTRRHPKAPDPACPSAGRGP